MSAVTRVAAVMLAAIVLGGCATYRRVALPGGTHWVGNRVWVPLNEARAVALDVCSNGTNYKEEGAETAEELAVEYFTVPVAGGGELIACKYGVRMVARRGKP